MKAFNSKCKREKKRGFFNGVLKHAYSFLRQESHCVVLTGLEVAMYKLDWPGIHRNLLLCFPGAGTSICHLVALMLELNNRALRILSLYIPSLVVDV